MTFKGWLYTIGLAALVVLGFVVTAITYTVLIAMHH